MLKLLWLGETAAAVAELLEDGGAREEKSVVSYMGLSKVPTTAK